MNNPRSYFFLFLLALGATGLMVRWWLGPTLVGIALDGDARSAPYIVLALDAGVGGTAFGVTAAELPEDSRLLWRSGQPMLALGPSVPGWERIELWQFPSGGSYVRFATGAAARAARDPQQRAVFGTSLGVPGAAAAVTEPLAYPVLFAARRDPVRTESLERALRPQLPRAARILWQLDVAGLGGSAAFDQWLLLSFPTEAERLEWLWGAEHQVALELTRKAFDELAVWELGSLSR
ncbi:MAG: hypothetical protein AAF552_16520 [Pseudomonadota bacterium]